MSAEPVTVLVVEDQAFYREALAALFARSPEKILLVGEARNAEQALDLARDLAPDVVLLDLKIPWRDGVHEPEMTEAGLGTLDLLVRECPASAVLVVTWVNDPDTLFDALRRGARGYVFKNADYDGGTLVSTILRVESGELVFRPDVAVRIAQAFNESADTRDRLRELSLREREVLRLLADGKSNLEIAAILVIAERTAEHHVTNILAKLGMSSRFEAGAYARFRGFRREP